MMSKIQEKKNISGTDETKEDIFLKNYCSSLSSKNILITGASGHLGLCVVKKLVEKGIKPLVLLSKSLKKEETNSKRSSINFLIKENNLSSFILNLGEEISDIDKKELQNKLQEIDLVLHLAAYVPKNANEDDLEKSMIVNVNGTINLLKMLKPNTKIVFVSTCEVYGFPTTKVISEEHPLNPLSYYGASKVAAEKISAIYCRKNKLLLTIARITTIYGPEERIQRAIPNFIQNAIEENALNIYGDGSDIRNFIYIEDAAIYLIALLVEGKEKVYNVCSEERVTIKEVAAMILSLSGSSSKIIYEQRRKKKIDYIFDASTIQRDISYKPQIKLEEGLSKQIKFIQQMKQN